MNIFDWILSSAMPCSHTSTTSSAYFQAVASFVAKARKVYTQGTQKFLIYAIYASDKEETLNDLRWHDDAGSRKQRSLCLMRLRPGNVSRYLPKSCKSHRQCCVTRSWRKLFWHWLWKELTDETKAYFQKVISTCEKNNWKQFVLDDNIFRRRES